jgi:hypothetical protein
MDSGPWILEDRDLAEIWLDLVDELYIIELNLEATIHK